MNFKNERNIRVILADPNEASRHLLRSALPPSSFIISETKGHDTILDQVKRGQIDIICLDTAFHYHLELIRTAKLLSPSIGIILISADASRRAVLKAVENGADDFIIKPYAPDRIQNAIIKCFGSRKQVPVVDP